MRVGWQRHLATFFGVVALTTLAAAACDPPPLVPHEPGGLAIVAGGRSNMPKLALVGAAVKMHDKAVLSKDRFLIVGVSSEPKVLYDEQIEHDCDSGTNCQAVVDNYDEQTADLLGKVRADAPEADTLGAILLAARNLAGVDGKGPKQIIVIDNGLQTAGDLQFQSPGALAVDPNEVAASLAKANKLKYLDGVEILFTGLGARYAPQDRLGSTEQANLEAIWRAVLEAGHARVTIDPSVLLEDASAGNGLPKVTSVPKAKPPVDTGTGCFRIREDQVGFKPDRADFRDPAAARTVLEPIAAELKAKNTKANVIGTTAYPEKDPSNPLSRERAEAVVKELVALGVPRSQLLSDGVGTQFGGYRNPLDANGNENPFIAVQDRLVLITPVGAVCPATAS